jgi:PhnB protein
MPEDNPTAARYNTLQPYLIISNCVAALEFYARALGATERMRMARPDGRIGHAEIQLGDSVLMMADEHPEIDALSPNHYGGSPVSLHLHVEDCDASFRRAISAGATPVREPADQPYGDRNAGVLDPFGYKWWFSTPLKKQE